MNATNQIFSRQRVRCLAHSLLIAIILLGFTIAGTALAADPLTGTLVGGGKGREIKFTYNGKSRNDWAGVLKLELDNGPTLDVFCIQLTVTVGRGDRYRSDGSVLALPNGCQIRYLLDHYPASSATTNDEAAARQLAIWVFSDNLDPSTIDNSASQIRDRVIALVNEARQGACPGRRVEPASLTLEPATASAAPGQTVSYTVRAGPADAGQTVTIALTGPATLADGQQAGSVTLDGQGVATFGVIGTGAGPSTVDVALPYRLESGTVFSQIDNNRKTQRLVMAEKAELVARASAQTTWTSGPPTPQPTPVLAPQPPTPQPTAVTAPQPTPRKRPPEQPTAGPEQPTAGPEQPTAGPEQPTQVITEGQPPAGQPQPPGGGTVGQPGGTSQGGPSQGGPSQPAGGAGPVQPRSLPRTGASGGGATWLALGLIVLLLTSGWLVRRRATRRRA